MISSLCFVLKCTITLLFFFVQPSTSTENCLEPPYVNASILNVVAATAAQAAQLLDLVHISCELILLQPDVVHVNKAAMIVVSSERLFSLMNITDAIFSVTDDVPRFLASLPQQHTTYEHPYMYEPLTNIWRLHSEGRGPPREWLLDWLDSDPFYSSYQSLSVMEERWTNISRAFSGKVTLTTAGESVEGRPIYVLRLGRTDEANPKRLVVTSLLHAREWATPPVVTYFVERLLLSDDPILSDVEVYVVPVANPDGLEYSGLVDRFWRKNRREPPDETGVRCFGVDLNRNWGVDFAGPFSTSADPCSEVYTGAEAFSEPETRALQSVLSLSGVKAHLDVHASGQFVLGPYAHSFEDLKNGSIVDDIGKQMTDAISNTFNNQYTFSRGAWNDVYPVSGLIMDWAFYTGIFSLTVEVRPAFDFMPIFHLPEDELVPLCTEMFAGMSLLLRYTAYGISLMPSNDSSPRQDNPQGTDSTEERGRLSALTLTMLILSASAGGLFILIVVVCMFRRFSVTGGR